MTDSPDPAQHRAPPVTTGDANPYEVLAGEEDAAEPQDAAERQGGDASERLPEGVLKLRQVGPDAWAPGTNA
jgi:hypothetical protein